MDLDTMTKSRLEVALAERVEGLRQRHPACRGEGCLGCEQRGWLSYFTMEDALSAMEDLFTLQLLKLDLPGWYMFRFQSKSLPLREGLSRFNNMRDVKVHIMRAAIRALDAEPRAERVGGEMVYRGDEYQDIEKAVDVLRQCDAADPEMDCDACPIGKKIGIDAHDAGVFIAFTACGMIAALQDAIEAGPLEWLRVPQPPLCQDA